MDEFSRPKTRIEWMLGNSCNYDCSYCLDLFKRGDLPFLQTETFADVCKDIIYHYDDLGRDVVFEFMGGEPTLMKRIPEIGKRLHNFPTNIVLKTNGSAGLDWWQNSRRFLSRVVISVHREFADLNHIKNVITLLQDTSDFHPISIKVLFPVTIRPESWEWGVRCVKKFRKRFGVGDLQLLYSNFGRGSNVYLPYKKEQWEEYYSLKSDITDLIEDNYEDKIFASSININGSLIFPSFKNHKCYAGLETLVIDPKGDVYRGWCEAGGKIGNIFDMPVNWPRDIIVCPREQCINGFDLKARKEP